MKIDQSFIRTIVSYRNNQLIVLWTIDLAHEFDCRITTEVVEPRRCAIISWLSDATKHRDVCLHAADLGRLRKSMTFDDA